MADWIEALTQTGRVRVARQADDAGDVAGAIASWDARVRADFPGRAPPLEIDVARWAAGIIWSACRCLVYRDIEGEEVERLLRQPCPTTARSPDVCYSADLFLRYLPDLISHARGLAEGDPLVVHLLELARAWPMSSVGVRDVGTVVVDAFIDDPSLLAAYVDRVLATGDASRLAGPTVTAATRAALGAHEWLAPPAIVMALRERSAETTEGSAHA